MANQHGMNHHTVTEATECAPNALTAAEAMWDEMQDFLEEGRRAAAAETVARILGSINPTYADKNAVNMLKDGVYTALGLKDLPPLKEGEA